MLKCLVTGASGFIGTALIQRLVKEGYQVNALIHTTPPKKKIPNVDYVYGDITDQKSIQGIIKKDMVIFHCAGIVSDFAKPLIYDQIHVKGTKNIIDESKGLCKRFIFVSHLPYESKKSKYPYQISKRKAESILLSEFQDNQFPMVIIRPGNVFGPNASTWVDRPLEAIRKRNIALINKGKGIFHHTYIDNLIDSLILSVHASDIEGEIIEITDGDNSITWGMYLNDLADMIGQDPIKRNLSKPVALVIGYLSMGLYRLFRIKPLVTPYAVEIFSNTHSISIEKAQHLLGYHPKISYQQAMDCVKNSL